MSPFIYLFFTSRHSVVIECEICLSTDTNVSWFLRVQLREQSQYVEIKTFKEPFALNGRQWEFVFAFISSGFCYYIHYAISNILSYILKNLTMNGWIFYPGNKMELSGTRKKDHSTCRLVLRMFLFFVFLNKKKKNIMWLILCEPGLKV